MIKEQPQDGFLKKFKKACYVRTDIYKFFLEMYRDEMYRKRKFGDAGKMNKEVFRDIHNEYNKLLGDYLIKGSKIKLPYSLGTLYIKKVRVITTKPNIIKYIREKVLVNVNLSGLEKSRIQWFPMFSWFRYTKNNYRKYYMFCTSRMLKKQLRVKLEANKFDVSHYYDNPY